MYAYLAPLPLLSAVREALPNTPVTGDYAGPVTIACAECTIQGVTMAERAEPPTVAVWVTF